MGWNRNFSNFLRLFRRGRCFVKDQELLMAGRSRILLALAAEHLGAQQPDLLHQKGDLLLITRTLIVDDLFESLRIVRQ